MSNIQMMWLFYGLLPCLVVISYCEGAPVCDQTVYHLQDLEKTSSSSLSTAYGADNIAYSFGEPWVANFSWPSNKSNNIYFEFNFKRLIHVPVITYISGGEVEGFRPNMTGKEKCFVTRFTVEYKTSNKSVHWTKLQNSEGYNVKFNSDNGVYSNKSIGINQPITALKLVIRRWHNCPAVRMDLRACGVCYDLSKTDGRSVTCREYNKTCTFKCKTGYKKISGSRETTCDINGVWSSDTFVCDDINECSGRPNKYCGKNTYCQNTRGGFTCTCQPGFTGDVTKCSDINECQDGLNNCDQNANCANTEGSFRCSCKRGYTGNGISCSDINECEDGLHNCDQNANCTNTGGSFNCSCKHGYTGSGISCSDVDECLTKTVCAEHAYCNNTIGSYNCTCKEGFSGDGKTCSGRQPIITDHSPTHRTIRFGKNLQLYCRASGLPLPIISWSVMPAKKDVSESKGTDYVRSELTINSVSLNDSRRYTCTAVNSFGKVVKSMNITVDGTPEAPKFSTKVKDVSINLSWKKPDSGASEITKYIIRYKNGRETKEKEENGAKTESTLDKLTPKTTYTISLVAVNDQGESDSCDIIKTTDVKKPPKISEPPKNEKRLSETSVRIRLTKINDRFVTHIQIIVEIKSSRKKREVSKHPQKISNYQEAEKNGESYYITGEVKKDLESFDVGDGKKYGNYTNMELHPEKFYNIYLRGVSYNSEMKPRYGKFSPPLEVAPYKEVVEGGSSNVIGIAVGVTVLVLVIVAVTVLVLYWRSRSPKTIEIDPETGKKKRRKRSLNSELLPLTKKGSGKRKSSSVEDGSPDPNHPPVAITAFPKHVGKLHKSDDRGFMIQYNTLETSQTYPSEVAEMAENKDKNRYANIIAYDVSRVQSRKTGGYINASYVDGHNSPNAYIATQGPLPTTFNDFWLMVWEENCSSIVMLTNLQEKHKIKCHKYWPENSEKYGDITVTATRREQYADYVIRSFHLKMNETEEEREMKQFHFTVWPDHGVPEYPTAILAFQRRVRSYSTRESGPIVVHCSAGVGRSGTFIVIDSMLARIQHEETVDIYNYVRYLRTRRMFMVQTEEQYVFCHDALLESILCGNTQIAAHNLRIEMNKLRTKDTAAKMTGFEAEFKTLEKVSPSLPKECFVVASYPENAPKNRYPDILASDHGRVALTAIDENVVTTYINAVFVDGYKQQNAFILTQVPLTETIKDFWRMLYEKRSACVLLLSDLSEEGDFPQFWPENGTEEYDSIKVELASDAAKSDSSSEDQFQQDQLGDDLVERKLKLTKEEDKPLVVKMFQHLSWKESAVPSDISGMVSLIQRIEKWQQHSGNGPITVVCNDGLGRGGTFAALCSVLERVKTEQVVDVFQTIKALRIQRPGLVKHVDQYEFIHAGVQEYLDSFSDYANFK